MFSLYFIVVVGSLIFGIVVAEEEENDVSIDHVYIAPSDVRYHLLSVPFSEPNEHFSPCAFTQKVVRWCRMLNQLGFKYYMYGNEGASAHCKNVVQLLSSAERQEFYGADEEWEQGKRHFDSDYLHAGAVEFRKRQLEEVGKRVLGGGKDVLLVTYGLLGMETANHWDIPAIEVGVGYEATFSFYRIFESYVWLGQATRKAMWDKNETVDFVSHYDAVLPMCYFSDEFRIARDKSGRIAVDVVNADTGAIIGIPAVGGETAVRVTKGQYVVFMARIVQSKGIDILVDMVRRTPDLVAVVAGQGDWEFVTRNMEPELQARMHYIGVVDPSERNHLVRHALALIAPTLYTEPFGSSMVEAQWLGTPVITTDHAGMAETVWHGVSGFRCRTLRCFVGALEAAKKIDRQRIVDYAHLNYNCEKQVYLYEDYMVDVQQLLTGEGWPAVVPAQAALTQKRFYPEPRTPPVLSRAKDGKKKSTHSEL